MVYLWARDISLHRPGNDQLLLKLTAGTLGLLDLATLTIAATLHVCKWPEVCPQLRNHADMVKDIAWSPDGKWLALRRDAPGKQELHLAHGDLSGSILLYSSDDDASFDGLSWAPRSTKLAVAARLSDDEDNVNVRIVDILRQKNRNADIILEPALCTEVFNLHWSPHDQYLALVTQYDAEEETRCHLSIADLYSEDPELIKLLDRDGSHSEDFKCLAQAVWVLDDSLWNVLLPGACLNISFDASETWLNSVDFELQGIPCMRNGHQTHVSPDGRVLVKAFNPSLACGLSNSALRFRNLTALPGKLAGPHIQAITWNPIDKDRCSTYACAVQAIDSSGSQSWQGQEVHFVDGAACKILGRWHPNSLVNADTFCSNPAAALDCGDLLNLTWSPAGSCLAVSFGRCLHLLRFTAFQL